MEDYPWLEEIFKEAVQIIQKPEEIPDAVYRTVSEKF